MRIGVIGTGEIALLHSEALRRAGTGFSAAYDVNADALSGFCRATGAKPLATAEELLTDNTVDTVFICTRHDSHVPLAVRALAAGKRVFMEKPLALSLVEAQPLLDMTETDGRLFVGYNMRHTPSMHTFKRLLCAHGAQIESFRANMTAAPFMEGWASDPETGGGVLVCEGSHLFDLISYTLGMCIEAVMAVTSRVRVGAERSPDLAALLLRLDNGAVGTLLLHDRGHYAFHVEPGGKMVNLTVYGPQGTYSADAYGSLRYGDEAGYHEERSVKGTDRVRDWGYEEQARLFVSGGEGLCTLRQAARVAAVADAAAKSACIGQWVQVKRI